jgi:hypothetical protein
MNVEPNRMECERGGPTASVETRTADDAVDLAAADFAARSGALADLLQHWRRPAVARSVIASLLADDGAVFRDLLNDFDPPLPGKCCWLRGVIERIVGDVDYRTVCRLRVDLTAGERWLCLQLVQRYQPDELPVPTASENASRAGLSTGAVIAAGPFLDALRAEGLVSCTEEPVQGVGLPQLLARPELVRV